MRSKANVKGHPLHTMLIPFPFAFLTGAVLFDAASLLLARPGFWTTGGHLAAAGVVAGLVAATPGLIDYFFTVPPDSSAKRRATWHMAVNVSSVGLFAAAWFLRRGLSGPDVTVLAIELVAVALLSAGGWMGGTLVTRNQIGVDHRYAGAGKWREQRIDGRAGAPIVVARRDDLEVDQMQLLHVAGKRIVLARTADGYVAFDDRCTHSGGSLAGGAMICGTVQCPWHGSQFDVRSGKVQAGPAKAAVKTYTIEEKQGEVLLSL